MLGFGNETAKGGLPRARVVSYKVCWSAPLPGCNDMDALAAIEAAISDGVDIINLSLTQPLTAYFQDGLSIGSFHAVRHGIPVIAGAGNSGPKPGSVTNVAPWILTVAASSMDTLFQNEVILGNKKRIQGGSFSDASIAAKFYPLINGVDAQITAKKGSLDPKKVEGKILVLDCKGINDGMEKFYLAEEAGAVGLILANEEASGYDSNLSNCTIPVSRISYPDGQALYSYINSTKSPVGSLTGATTKLGTKPAPFMGDFSSRGPNLLTNDLLKPDVTAPGVQVLGATYGFYRIVDGTSFATPHVTAIAGLLKKLHPQWSTAAIRSALMTTASPLDNTGKPIREENLVVEATPFAYGSGHVQPIAATDPGLVYDMDHRDYLGFLCKQYGYDKMVITRFSSEAFECPKDQGLLNFNYPSITIYNFTGRATVATRKLKNVGRPGTYTARVEAPSGVSVVVEPKTMIFAKEGQVIEYKLTFTANVKQLPDVYTFGSLVWSDGKHIVRSPIVIIPLGKLERDFANQ